MSASFPRVYAEDSFRPRTNLAGKSHGKGGRVIHELNFPVRFPGKFPGNLTIIATCRSQSDLNLHPRTTEVVLEEPFHPKQGLALAFDNAVGVLPLVQVIRVEIAHGHLLALPSPASHHADVHPSSAPGKIGT